MRLNNRQKQFLLDNKYVTAKTLDAAIEWDWQKYFITKFEWELAPSLNKWGMHVLELFEVGVPDEVAYEVYINFQGTDFDIFCAITE